MTMLDTIEGYLNDSHTPYQHTTHRLAFTARECARAEHIPVRNVAKTVVINDNTGYALAVLPGDSVVDLYELRRQLGRTHLRLASETEIAHLFADCELGAMPPLGKLCGLPVYVDAALARREFIAFHAGTHRDAVHMRYTDFERLAEPRVLHFARVVQRQAFEADDL